MSKLEEELPPMHREDINGVAFLAVPNGVKSAKQAFFEIFGLLPNLLFRGPMLFEDGSVFVPEGMVYIPITQDFAIRGQDTKPATMLKNEDAVVYYYAEGVIPGKADRTLPLRKKDE